MRQAARGGLLIACAAAAIWLSVRNAAIEQWNATRPDRAAAFWPATGEAQAQIALNRVASANGVPGDADRALARAALDRAPLLANPFILAGLDASAVGDEARARALFEEAQHRNPRATVARFWLLDDYYSTKDYRPFLDEVAPAIALQPEARDPVLDSVDALLADPRTAAMVARKLRQQPRWRADFLRRASHDDGGLIGPLLLAAPNPDPKAAAAEQQAAIGQFFGTRQFDAAYRFWLAANRLPADRSGIFDGNFSGRIAAPPFNWSIDGDVAHYVMVDQRGSPARTGLKISYGGSAVTPIAGEAVMLAPGRYRISGALWSDQPSGTDSPFLTLQIGCIDDGETIGQAVFNDLSTTPAARILDFSVPDKCGGVNIEYIVHPGISTDSAAFTLTGVQLRKVAARPDEPAAISASAPRSPVR